jgi:membrane fusion protein (multidrug efflux system)
MGMFGGMSSLLGGQITIWHRLRASWVGIAVLLCIALAAEVGCEKQERQVPKEVSINVKVWTAEKRSLQPYVESVGTLKAYEEVIVSSELDGILKTIRVEEGSPVKQGQPIAEIKETDYRLDAERATVALKQAEASLVYTKQDYERKEALYQKDLIAKQQIDDASARLVLAQGDVDRAKMSLDLAREKLAKTSICAPMAGTVKEKRVTAGEYIRNGTFLVSIIRTDMLKLCFTITERDVGCLRAGQDVAFRVDAYPGREFRGQLKTIYPSLEEKTRSLQLEAVLTNADQSLKPGLFARVILYTGSARGTVVVPITALLYDNSSTKLFVVEGVRAKERQVKIGQKYEEFMEITEGLKEGEIVVTVGQNNLMEGVLVNVAR